LAWTGIAILSFLFWYSRWFYSQGIPDSPDALAKLKPFLHLGIVLFIFDQVGATKPFIKWWFGLKLTPLRLGLLFYLLLSIFGGILLLLPFNQLKNSHLSLIDAFFTSVSALTVTGLTTVSVSQTLSKSGLVVILALIQLGGIGIVAFSLTAATVFKRRFSLGHTKLGQQLYGNPEVGEVSVFLWKLLVTFFALEIIGAAFLYTLFPEGISDRFFHAVFHSISAFCNAGFSSFDDSLNFSGGIPFKICICILLVAGGFGFPALFEFFQWNRIKNWFVGRQKSQQRASNLSENFRLTLFVSLALWISGALLIFLGEVASGARGVLSSLGDGLFYTFSSRTAGFNTTPVADLSSFSQTIIGMLMFIGGGAVSAAGGIKTSTLGVLVMSVRSFLKGHQKAKFGRSEIPHEVIIRSLAVLLTYLAVLFFAVILLRFTEPMALGTLVFESISALSTVGLSAGQTSEFSPIGKLILCFLMLAGRFGILAMISVGIGNGQRESYRLPPGRFFIG